MIALSGNAGRELALEALREGAQDCLFKNETNGVVLVRSIAYALERNRLLRDLENALVREHQAMYRDPLTQLPNRQMFREQLEQVLGLAERQNEKVGMLLLDLDHFKKVNEMLGTGSGDLVLQEVAKRIRESVRKSDIVARLDGDEFGVILPAIKRAEDISGIVGKIQDRLRRVIYVSGQEVFMEGSLGATVFPDHARDLESVLQNAEIAMVRAKTEGGNRFQYCSNALNRQVLERQQMENDLRRALELKQFSLVLQPLGDFSSGDIVGAEALVRWKHPEKGMVSPAVFIPVAEEAGLIEELGDWIFREACLHLKNVIDSGYEGFYMSINLSARQFQQTDLLNAGN